MAFLDNSGDIILDAVLTDTGRMRLARGDGSFRVVKFALADDEIDYSLYNKNASGGTAYYDVEVLQTPILEAFTNNASSMKTKLISISRNNLLYLPVIKVNDTFNGPSNYAISELVVNGYILAADQDTNTYLVTNTTAYDGVNLSSKGILRGDDPNAGGASIRLDQGLDTIEIPFANSLDPDLLESQYLIEIDNRFFSLTSAADSINASPSYIDDDNIATYYLSQASNSQFVSAIPGATVENASIIAGPRGTMLMMKLKSSIDVNSSDYLFNNLGIDISSGFGLAANSIKSILANIRVVGVTTGSSIDIPILIIKKLV